MSPAAWLALAAAGLVLIGAVAYGLGRVLRRLLLLAALGAAVTAVAGMFVGMRALRAWVGDASTFGPYPVQVAATALLIGALAVVTLWSERKGQP